jgi:eukaryotic-like serine/threonine-protein kinase
MAEGTEPSGHYCPDCWALLAPRESRCGRCGRARPSVGWPSDPLLLARVAGRFRVERLLGRGGFGAVYVVRHETLEGRRALKVLRRELMHDDALLERFHREARALYQLDAPQLVKVEEYGRLEDGRPYMVLELAEGERLDAVVATTGGLPPLRAVRIAREVLLALSEAHRAGILHRDLKTENIIVKSDPVVGERVKVLDLGIAFMLDSERLTRATRTVGTPEYMAPEQWRGEALDGRCDLYAVGVLLYEMLLCEVPYPREAGGVAAIYHRLMQERPAPLREKRADVPAALEGLVLRLLAREREARPGSAVAALGELEAVRRGM